MQAIWEIRDLKEEVAHGEQSALSLSLLARNLLTMRSIRSPEEVERFLFPNLDHLHDPLQMKGMREGKGAENIYEGGLLSNRRRWHATTPTRRRQTRQERFYGNALP